MRLISPTRLQKAKLKEMVLKLYPDYRVVIISDKGIISLYKSIWHFILQVKKTVYVSDMCIVHIPEKLEELNSNVFEEGGLPVYNRVYHNYSHIVLELLHRRDSNIIDYLYNEFAYIKHGIMRTYYVNTQKKPEPVFSLSEMLHNPSIKYGDMIFSRLSSLHAKQSLKHWKDSLFVLHHPKLLSKTLNLWFRKELKQEIGRCLQLEIKLNAA